MRNQFLVVLVLVGFIAGCKSGKKETSRLNIVLFGYDSIACYYGNSAEMIDLRYGKLTDSLFMNTVLTAAIDRKPGLIVLKPGGGAAVLGNWEHVDTLFKINNFKNRKIDTLDEKEQEFFKTTSIIPYLKKSHEEPLKLFLPKEEGGPVHEASGKGLVVLILNENIYTYNGVRVKDGRRCTYKELELYLGTKKSDRNFFVVIKFGKKSNYKSVVDMLDLMAIEKVKNYKIEDVTEEDEAFINKMVK